MRRRLPDWIRASIPAGDAYTGVKRILAGQDLNTICAEARCPNIGECLSAGTATFLLLGKVCTRNCRYCAVGRGAPAMPDPDEPARIAGAARAMALSYVVVTSVTRDDLPDAGASHFAAVVRLVRERVHGARIETLLPDFRGGMEDRLDAVLFAGPDVVNHNIEVARPLYRRLRPLGDYRLSLDLLARAARSGFPAKSGLMIGFGESRENIRSTLQDLLDAGCSMLTVGQYLQPRRSCPEVARFYTPEEFLEIGEEARSMGFASVQSGPLVRSSYHAAIMSSRPGD